MKGTANVFERIAAIFSREKKAGLVIEEFETISQQGVKILRGGDEKEVRAWLDRYREYLGLIERYRDTDTIREFAKNKKMFELDGTSTGRTLYDRLYKVADNND